MTTAPKKSSSKELRQSAALSKESTASVGKFQELLPKEKPDKVRGRKRQFESAFGDAKEEQKKTVKNLEAILSKAPVINADKAANKMVQEDQRAGRNMETKFKAPKRRSKAGEHMGSHGGQRKRGSKFGNRRGGKRGGKR